jgi:hypothetical protein
MKTLLAIMIAAIVGSLLFWRVGLAIGNPAGSIVANAVLFFLLTGYAASRPKGLAPSEVVAASVGATALLGACAMIGAVVFEKSPALGNMMMAAVSVGYYPPGADMPLLPGFGLWGASFMAVTLAGLVAGSLVRPILRKADPQDVIAIDSPKD